MRGFTFLFLLSVFQFSVYGQTKLSGRIVNNQNSPLPGANIWITETNSGTSTNEKGVFEMEVPGPGTYQLIVSFVGYQTIEKTFEVKPGTATLQLPDIQLLAEAFEMELLTVKAVRAVANTPITFTNLTKKELEKNNLSQDVPYLLKWTPSTVVTSDAGTGIGYTGIRIRGTDPTRTNVTINGVPLNDAESQGVFWVNLPDFVSSAESIQIQRGVGTSTYGTGAFGATINFNTTNFQENPYADINLSGGSFNTFKRNVQFGSGLIDQHFSIEGRLSKITSDGYIDRASADLDAYFLSANYLGKNNSLHFTTFSGHEVTYQSWFGTDPSLLENEDTRRSNLAGTEKDGEPYDNQVDDYAQTHYQLHYNQKLSPFWKGSLAAYYVKGQGFFEEYAANQALSFYNLPNLQIGNDTITTSDLVRRRWLDNDFYGTNLGLSFENPTVPFQLSLNAGYSNYQGNHFGEVIWAAFFTDETQLDQRYYDEDAAKQDLNLFTKLNYQITPKLNAYLDLQYRWVDYELLGFDGLGNKVPQNDQHNFFNPKIGLFAQMNPQFSWFASYGITNREPNRSDYLGRSVNDPPKHEQLNDLELGFHYNWKKAAINANLYYMDYKNQLALNGDINQDGEFTRINIPDSYRLGIEITGGFEWSNFSFNGNLTLSENKIQAFTESIDNFDDSFFEIDPVIQAHENTNLAFSPGIISGTELTYHFLKQNEKQDLNLSILNKYVGEQYIDNTGDEQNVIDAYHYMDMRLVYGLDDLLGKRVQITFLVRNVLDQWYETNAWSYRFAVEGSPILAQGFYPQAGRNFLAGIKISF